MSGNLRGRLDRIEQELGMGPAPEPAGLTVVKLGPPKRGPDGRPVRAGSDGKLYVGDLRVSELVYWGKTLVKLIGSGVGTPGHCSMDDL